MHWISDRFIQVEASELLPVVQEKRSCLRMMTIRPTTVNV